MPRLHPRLLFALLLAALGVAVYFGWRSYSERRDWNALRPPVPALVGNAAPGLDARLGALAARLEAWPPDRAALAEFTRVCHANGQLDSAVAGYNALMKLDPTEPRWPHLLALIIAGYGELDQALPLMQRTTQLAPGYVSAWLKLGEAYLKSNSIAEAYAAYEHVLGLDRENVYALVGLARCDLQSERLTAARAHLQQAVAGKPDFVGAQSLLAMVYDQLGNNAAAAAARSRVQRSGHYTEAPDPWAEELVFECHDPYTLLTAASAAAVEEKMDRSLALLERALKLAPNDARLHRQLGKTLAIRADYPGARRELERAVALDPANDALRFDLLALLRKVEDDDAYAKIVQAGLAASPDSSGLQFEAGRLAAKANRLDEALQHLEYSWRLGRDQPAPGLQLADVYYRTGRTDSAVALLEDLIVRFPNDNTALLMLIRQGARTGDSRTPGWLDRAARGGAPEPLLQELREQYGRRAGAVAP